MQSRKGCGRLRNAFKLLTVLTASHERKHDACRAEIGGCVTDYTYISTQKIGFVSNMV